MNPLPPISLYIHFPWCVQKCPYCDFNSHALKGKMPDEAYLNALIRDMEYHLPALQGRKIISIFLGGGTPSLFPTAQMAKLFEYLDQKQILAEDCEITLEANPGTIERGYFSEYHQMGINRISLGVQTFQHHHLHKLGRIHSSDDVYHAVSQLKQAGFSNFNIDIMHGLPQQQTAEAIDDLQQALLLEPTHISWYQLTIEPNTAFAHTNPTLPDEDTLDQIETQGKALLASYGFEQYETSAFTRNGAFPSRHNLNYWRYGDYVGIGAGAHGKITWKASSSIERIWKHKHPKIYLSSDSLIHGQNQVNIEDRIYEFAFNSLRLFNGVEQALFEQTTLLPLERISTQLEKAQKLGLLDTSHQRLKPTKLGTRYLNDLIDIFHPEHTL